MLLDGVDAVNTIAKLVTDEDLAHVSESFEIVKRLSSWDKRFPKNQVKNFSDAKVKKMENELDSIASDATDIITNYR